MSSEHMELAMAPGPVSSASTNNDSALQSVVVRTADGRTFDLGRPTIPYLKWGNPLFHFRLWLYKLRRRKEFSRA